MNEKENKHEEFFDGLVERSLVPRGFRPETDEEIEAMLGGLGGGEISQDKLQRMLGKIQGCTPMAWEVVAEESDSWQSDSAEAKELAEMYRAKGEKLPSELEAKLREMEEKASGLPDEDDDSDGN